MSLPLVIGWRPVNGLVLKAALLLAVLGALRAEAANGRIALKPRDRQLLDGRRLLSQYESFWALQPEVEATGKELAGFAAGYAQETGKEPGGRRREALRARLSELIGQLYERKVEFRHASVAQRFVSTLGLVADIKRRRTRGPTDEFDAFELTDTLFDEMKDYQARQMTLLDEDKKAYEAALRHHQERRADRLRRELLAGAGAAAVLAGFAFARRRRPQAAALPAAAGALRTGRYALLREGRPWAFGARFDAVQDGTNRPVSLGRLDARLSPRPADAARLALSLRAASAFKHPALPALVEAFSEGGAAFLATNPSAGKPLASWLARGDPVSLPSALRVLRLAADLLDRAHEAGLLHGGLTPDRLLVADDGGVTVEDFGLAPLCHTLRPAGPAYMAPEQELGRPKAESDLYALGLILYETISGRHPFEGVNILAMKRERRYTPPTRLNPAWPPALDALMAGLLDPDPETRLPRPGGLRKALEGLG